MTVAGGSLRRRARLIVIGCTMAGLSFSTMSGVAALDATPSGNSLAAGVPGGEKLAMRPDPVSAMSTAQTENIKVVDESGLSESSMRVANPDGSWTVVASAGQVRTQDASGAWVPVDSSVVKGAKGFTQRHGAHDVRFSSGGNRNLAKVVTPSGKSIGLTSASDLPTPTVDGSQLLYGDSAHGDDMIVRSFAEGFNFSVIIAERPDIDAPQSAGDGPAPAEKSDAAEPAVPMQPAAVPVPVPAASEAPTNVPSPSPEPTPSPTESTGPLPEPSESPTPEPSPTTEPEIVPTPTETQPPPEPAPAPTETAPEYVFGLDAAGLTTRVGEIDAFEGLPTDVTDEGTIVFKDGKKVVASASQPVMWDAGEGDERHTGKVDLAVESGKLVLRPDPAFLADSQTTFPVTVDPSVVLNVASDTWVHSLLDTSSQVDSPELRVGSNNFGLDKARAYLNFDLASLPSDIVVSDADVNLVNFSTGSCTGSAVTMNRITGSWATGSLTWANQPAVTTAGQSSTTTALGSAACPEGIVSFDAAQMVTDWAGGAANLGVRIKADTESQASGYRSYRSMENGDPTKVPSLSVTYNTRPSVVGH